MKQNTAIFILSQFPVFNQDLVPRFETFSKENSSYLFSTLVFNHKELTEKLSDSANTFFCFNKNDEELIPANISNPENLFYDSASGITVLKSLSEKYFYNYTNNIVVFSNSIGLTPEDITKTINLLSMEDESIVVGKSTNQSLSFFGFNSFNPKIFNDVELSSLNYDAVLNQIARHENFIHILDNFMLIKDVNDFKILYHNLSKKESFAYCSQNIHERFTNLFIEYKDLLK